MLLHDAGSGHGPWVPLSICGHAFAAASWDTPG